jgi:putative redox protein
MRTVTITWDPTAEQFHAVGTHRAHRIVINAPEREPQPDGTHRPPTGFSPTELLLAGAASCAAWDVVLILRKQRQELIALDVQIAGEQEPDPPWRYLRLSLEFQVTGRNLDQKRVRRAVRMSVDRYCSVLATVRVGTDVVDTVTILDELGAPAVPA